MLRWLEYPPDANHGFYLPSATITTRLRDNKNTSLLLAAEDSTMSHSLWGNPAAGGSGDVLRIYTETLLVSLPTPDFSMPYNVICLVGFKCKQKVRASSDGNFRRALWQLWPLDPFITSQPRHLSWFRSVFLSSPKYAETLCSLVKRRRDCLGSCWTS